MFVLFTCHRRKWSTNKCGFHLLCIQSQRHLEQKRRVVLEIQMQVGKLLFLLHYLPHLLLRLVPHHVASPVSERYWWVMQAFLTRTCVSIAAFVPSSQRNVAFEELPAITSLPAIPSYPTRMDPIIRAKNQLVEWVGKVRVSDLMCYFACLWLIESAGLFPSLQDVDIRCTPDNKNFGPWVTESVFRLLVHPSTYIRRVFGNLQIRHVLINAFYARHSLCRLRTHQLGSLMMYMRMVLCRNINLNCSTELN